MSKKSKNPSIEFTTEKGTRTIISGPDYEEVVHHVSILLIGLLGPDKAKEALHQLCGKVGKELGK